MVEAVGADVAANGNAALLAGPWQGRPYKLFALASGNLGLSAIGLALLTIPGRLARFAVSIALASYLRWFFSRWIPKKVMLTTWAAFWILIYSAYWLA